MRFHSQFQIFFQAARKWVEDEEEGSLEMLKNNLFVFLIKSRKTSLEDKKDGC